MFGHKLRFAGHSNAGWMYECVREKNPMPEASWNPKLVEKAYQLQKVPRDS